MVKVVLRNGPADHQVRDVRGSRCSAGPVRHTTCVRLFGAEGLRVGVEGED